MDSPERHGRLRVRQDAAVDTEDKSRQASGPELKN
jgi:hypothetical protein